MSALWEGVGAGAGSIGREPRPTVFVSSTLGELNSEREAAKSAIKTLRLVPAGVDLGSSGEQEGPAVEEAGAFVGIYWQTSGWPGDGGTDLVRDYERSVGIPGLVYVKEPAPERDEGLNRLLDRIRVEGRMSIRSFESPGELAEMLVEDLPAILAQRDAGSEPLPGSLPLGTLTFMFGDLAGST